MSDEGNDVLPLTDAFVHFGRREVVRGEVRTPLSPNESDLLQYLATRPSQTLSKKELLREVFGYVDGSRSRTLQTTMQRLRQKVENDPAQPVHLVNVYGKGYRFESLAGMSNHSIKSSPSIIGRAKERTRLYEGLEAERCMQVVGQGGIGKTSLAQVQAQLWRSSATVWFCDLSAAKTLSHVLTRLGEVLNLKSVDGPERIGHALQGHGRALLILDNVEQLEEGLSSWITDWLEQTEVLRILVTSRITLELPGGVLRVAPLPRREAQQLFQRRASAADADAVLETTLVEQIVKTLEGIPLAIELAAARLTLLSLAEVAEGVQQQLKLLSGGPSGRHQTMRATIAWSWTLLSPEAQHLLAQTAVFAGGFPVSAVAEVFLEPEAEAGLMELKSQSLIQVQKSALGSRWVSFENVRAFAQEKLEKNVWRADLESRHETWCLRMGERWLDANESGENEAMARLTCERANLEYAFNRAWEKRSPAAAHLALILEPFFRMQDHPARGIAYMDKGLAVWPADGAREIAARLHLARGNLRYKLLHKDGQEDIEQALALADPDSRVAAKAEIVLGNLHRGAMRWMDATACYQRAHETLQGVEPCYTRTNLVIQKGILAQHRGEFQEAERFQRRALSEARMYGLERAQLTALGQLSTLNRAMGHLAEAEGFHREALSLATQMKDMQNQAVLLGHLANLLLLQGRFSESEETLQAAWDMERKYGGRGGVGYVLMSLGSLFIATQRHEKAIAHLSLALAALSEVGYDRAWIHCMTQLGRAYRRMSRFEEAERVLTQAIEPETRQHFPTCFSYCQRAMVRAEQGRVAEASEDLQRAEAQTVESDVSEVFEYLKLAETYIERAAIMASVAVGSQKAHLRPLLRTCEHREKTVVGSSRCEEVLLHQAWRLLAERMRHG